MNRVPEPGRLEPAIYSVDPEIFLMDEQRCSEGNRRSNLSSICRHAAIIALSASAAVVGVKTMEQTAFAADKRPTPMIHSIYPAIKKPTSPAAVECLADQRLDQIDGNEIGFINSIGIRKFRVVMSWNIMDQPEELNRLKNSITVAESSGKSIEFAAGYPNPNGATRIIPSTKQYHESIVNFIGWVQNMFPSIKKSWSPFNEANHGKYQISPMQAARYYKEMRSIVPNQEEVIAGDFNTEGVAGRPGSGTMKYVRKYFRALDKLRVTPKVFSLHFDQGDQTIRDVLQSIPSQITQKIKTASGKIKTLRKQRPRMHFEIPEAKVGAEEGTIKQNLAAKRLLKTSEIPARTICWYQLKNRGNNPDPGQESIYPADTKHKDMHWDSAMLGKSGERPVVQILRQAMAIRQNTMRSKNKARAYLFR